MDSQNSQDVYSQSLLRFRNTNHIDFTPTNGANSDYWSQSSNSQQPEENCATYSSKPLLFNSKQFQQPKQSVPIKSFRNFYEIQNRNSVDNQQRNILENFVALLRDCSSEIKTTVESLKSEVSIDLKENVNAISSSIFNSEELLKKLKEDICAEMSSNHEEVESVLTLKEEIFKKDGEIEVRTEKIQLLQAEIQSLKARVTSFENKESVYFEDQKIKLAQLLSQCEGYAQNMKDVKDMNFQISSHLNNAVNESRVMSQQIQVLSTNQQQKHLVQNSVPNCFPENFQNISSSNSSSFAPTTVYPQNRFGSARLQYNGSVHHQNLGSNILSQPAPNVDKPSVQLPRNNPLSHYSPIPPFTRKLDVHGRPSPTAVIKPLRQKEKVKEEYDSIQGCKMNKSTSKDVFLLSSDSESGDDISEMIKTVMERKVLRKYKKPQKEPPVDALNTPKLNDGSDVCRSSPVQRSIRRYGKIRRNANKHFPSPLLVKNKCSNENVDASGRVISKNKPTLESLWKEAVASKSKPIQPPPKKFLKTSRGSLAMRRNQENSFNFTSEDDDIQQLADILSNSKRRRHQIV